MNKNQILDFLGAQEADLNEGYIMVHMDDLLKLSGGNKKKSDFFHTLSFAENADGTTEEVLVAKAGGGCIFRTITRLGDVPTTESSVYVPGAIFQLSEYEDGSVKVRLI